jgi:hypothetical protein
VHLHGPKWRAEPGANRSMGPVPPRSRGRGRRRSAPGRVILGGGGRQTVPSRPPRRVAALRQGDRWLLHRHWSRALHRVGGRRPSLGVRLLISRGHHLRHRARRQTGRRRRGRFRSSSTVCRPTGGRTAERDCLRSCGPLRAPTPRQLRPGPRHDDLRHRLQCHVEHCHRSRAGTRRRHSGGAGVLRPIRRGSRRAGRRKRSRGGHRRRREGDHPRAISPAPRRRHRGRERGIRPTGIRSPDDSASRRPLLTRECASRHRQPPAAARIGAGEGGSPPWRPARCQRRRGKDDRRTVRAFLHSEVHRRRPRRVSRRGTHRLCTGVGVERRIRQRFARC